MTATRAPVLGIVIAVVVLLAECIGLIAYKYSQQNASDERSALVARARAEQIQLDRLFRDIERLDAQIAELQTRRRSHAEDSEIEQLRMRLWQLRHDRRMLNDMLIRQAPRQPR
ncbi:MAG TPA: hypothetical protein VIV11_37030 [Kofleriaceae bacterium]